MHVEQPYKLKMDENFIWYETDVMKNEWALFIFRKIKETPWLDQGTTFCLNHSDNTSPSLSPCMTVRMCACTRVCACVSGCLCVAMTWKGRESEFNEYQICHTP